jgi:hypothetical protein
LELEPAAYLVAAGEALFGPRWKASLAEELAVADRTLRHWIAGRDPVPVGVIADLKRMVAERRDRLASLAR